MRNVAKIQPAERRDGCTIRAVLRKATAMARANRAAAAMKGVDRTGKRHGPVKSLQEPQDVDAAAGRQASSSDVAPEVTEDAATNGEIGQVGEHSRERDDSATAIPRPPQDRQRQQGGRLDQCSQRDGNAPPGECGHAEKAAGPPSAVRTWRHLHGQLPAISQTGSGCQA